MTAAPRRALLLLRPSCIVPYQQGVQELKFSLFATLFNAMTASLGAAGTMTQTVPFDYDVNFGVTFPVIEGFDTQGGTRALTSVTFEFNHNFALDLYMESTGPTAVAAEDYVLDLAYITLFQLGLATADGGPPGPPAFGPGALFIEDISGALAAYDGVPGNDGPDSFRRSFSDAFTSAQTYGQEEPAVLTAVTDVGPLTTVLGGFSELFFEWFNPPDWPPPPGGFPEYPNDAALWASFPTFRHFGDIVVTYDYAPVPEPTTGLGLAVLGLAARRRR